MREFTLYLNIQGDWTSISSPLGEDLLRFSTFDENLNESENNQYELTFSIVAKSFVDNKVTYNPYLQFLFIGAKLHLIMDSTKRIDLIIKNITPQTHGLNSIYQFTAQDEVSYLWARHKVGYTYSTLHNGILTPKSIFQIAKEVLNDCHLYDWSITTQSFDAELEIQKFILENVGSNPYAVLIEACNTCNAYMDVNYFTKQLDFYRKNLVRFSGYRYHPERTLIEYSPSNSGEELTTVLHVSGGTDAEGRIVSITPSLPFAVRQWFEQQLEEQQWDAILKDFEWGNVKPIFIVPEEHSAVLYVDGTSLGCTVTIEGKDYDVPLWLAMQSGEKGEQIIFEGAYNGVIRKSSYKIHLNYKATCEWVENGLSEIVLKIDQDASTINYSLASRYLKQYSPIFETPFELKNKNEETIFNIESSNTYNIVSLDPQTYEGQLRNGNKEDNLLDTIHFTNDVLYPFESFSNRMADNDTYYYYRTDNSTNDNQIQRIIFQKSVLDEQEALLMKEQEQELENFFKLVEKTPYLGQSIIDFSPFRFVIGDDNWLQLDKLLNSTLRNCNIKLQYYSESYYKAASLLTSIRGQIYNYAEQYASACKHYQEIKNGAEGDSISQKQEIEKAENKLKSYISILIYLKDGNNSQNVCKNLMKLSIHKEEIIFLA